MKNAVPELISQTEEWKQLKKILLKVKVSQNLMGKRKPEGALSKCGLLGSPSDTLIH